MYTLTYLYMQTLISEFSKYRILSVLRQFQLARRYPKAGWLDGFRIFYVFVSKKFNISELKTSKEMENITGYIRARLDGFLTV